MTMMLFFYSNSNNASCSSKYLGTGRNNHEVSLEKDLIFVSFN